jgi:membrane-associated phospholipid phosphatase
VAIQIDKKSVMLQHRFTQAAEKQTVFDNTINENPDIGNEVYEGLYGKGLLHNSTTKIPEENEITKLRLAMATGKQVDFDNINLGGTRRLVNPQAGLSRELSGMDPAGTSIPACPTLGSVVAASEMLEVYEKALLRDTPFSVIEAGVDANVVRAIGTLNNCGSSFTGPKVNNLVTAQTLFRGNALGCSIGPYISQLLLRDVSLGAHTIQQKYNYEQGVYGITDSNWFEIQKGNVPVAQQANGTPRYINNGRALGSFVHVDFVFQAYYYALAILLKAGASIDPGFASLSSEETFCTYGGPAELAASLAEVSRHSLKAAWVVKWINTLRLRPETMAHRVQVQSLNGSLTYVNPNIYTWGTNTLTAVKAANLGNGGSSKLFLPLQYAEGSPTHPSYPAGHAALSGACATFLKIMLNDTKDWSTLSGIDTILESTDGTSLTSYSGLTTGMTVGTELNKLAANISIGRNIAGVHYRSDGDEGMNLGEKVAIYYVKDLLSSYNESRPSLTLTKFDGTTITI